MNIDIILFKIISVILLLNMLIPVSAFILDLLLSFWRRKELSNWAINLQKFKYGSSTPETFGLDWIGGIVAIVITGCFAGEGVLSVFLLIILIILAVFYAPRFVLDLCKGLKFNNNTGDLERIDLLQKELDDLKKKVDKQS